MIKNLSIIFINLFAKGRYLKQTLDRIKDLTCGSGIWDGLYIAWISNIFTRYQKMKTNLRKRKKGKRNYWKC